jgi:hypothetical protein
VGEMAAVSRILAVSPSLGVGALAHGATRQTPKDDFLDEIVHYEAYSISAVKNIRPRTALSVVLNVLSGRR